MLEKSSSQILVDTNFVRNKNDFIEAVEKGNIGKTQYFLEQGIHVDMMKDGVAGYPLITAIRNRNNAMVDLLLLNGADIRGVDGNGEKDYPIKVAINNKDKDLIMYLLENYDNGVYKELKKIGKLIFDKEIFTTKELKTILKNSSENGNIEMFEFLLNLVYHPNLEKDAIESVNERYNVGEILGKGSYGTVYKGEDKNTGREVAIKIQRSKEEDMLMELDILERISKDCDEYFLCIYEVIRQVGGDIQIVVMELIDGVDFETLMRKRKKLPDKEIKRIMDILEISIGKLHDLGVAHKDIKPNNIMVTRDGMVKLVDYGMSCLDTECKWGGTPDYMHPYLKKKKDFMSRHLWELNDWFSLFMIALDLDMDIEYIKRIKSKFTELDDLYNNYQNSNKN
jgi:serine/threonine protein kinase